MKENKTMSDIFPILTGNKSSSADFLVQNEGTIFLFRPLTEEAAAHLQENVQEDAQWFGGALVVEHRYARDLADQLTQDGFTVE
jgi:hypothetical protein